MTIHSRFTVLQDGYRNPVGVVSEDDGYKLQTTTRLTDPLPAGTNVIGQIGIDPTQTGGLATETTLSDAYNKLISLDGKDFATETTLAGLEGKDFATETTLAAIKDTDGIKKITDPLPDGYNAIGEVSITNSDHSKTVTVIDDVDTPTNKRLLVETDFKPGATLNVTTGAAAGTGTVSNLLLNGSSSDMVVNGAGTPATFTYSADPTNDIQLTSLRLVFSASSFAFNGTSFGKGGGALSNGVEIDITANGGTFSSTLATLNVNEDFLRLLEFSISQAGSTDIMAASIVFGGRVILEGGSGDNINVTINDNLTTGARGISYFTATLYGIVEI